MSLWDHDQDVAEAFLEVFNKCPNCGKSTMSIIRDKYYSQNNDVLGIECKTCGGKAVSTINKKCMYTIDSFKPWKTTLPAHINIDDVSKQEMMLLTDPNDWKIDKTTIRQYALFLMRMFKDDCDNLPKNQKLIEEM